MTEDLDILQDLTDQPEPLTEAQIAVALGLVAGMARRIPTLPRRQRRHHAGILVAYCRHVAVQLPPERAAIYLDTARLVAELMNEVEYVQ
jgi:hypothetical protein